MTAILEQLQGLVAAAAIPAGTLGVALILGLFGLLVVGLVLGQELAFVLGGAGVIVGWLAWGTPGVTIAMTKIYDQMQSYSMVAIPMFVLMANFPVSYTHLGERGLLPDLLQRDLLEAPGLIEYGTGIDNLRFPRVRQLF